jgi:hypothetical protein
LTAFLCASWIGGLVAAGVIIRLIIQASRCR